MTTALLDVNALIALLWQEHPFHNRCVEWFTTAASAGWATCPVTESGFVRLLSNPAFTANPPSVSSALRVLQTATESGANHQFWKDDLPLSTLRARWSRGLNHKQITDAYLLALTVHHRGCLVTFDAKMVALAGDGNMERDRLEILRA
jgi:hypothetical protein